MKNAVLGNYPKNAVYGAEFAPTHFDLARSVPNSISNAIKQNSVLDIDVE